MLALLAELDDKNCPACGAEMAAGEASPEASSQGGAGSGGVGSPRAVPTRFGRVSAPQDPLPEAQALLTRVRMLARRQLADQEPLLAHFFNDTDTLLKRLATKPAEGVAVPDDKEKKKLREDLDQALDSLEDMVALWNHRLPR
jgi:hypothetical protein